MVCFGILGMLFKAVSWSMGYILIAKGDSKLFIKTAIGFSCLSLLLNVLFYFLYGLEGLGFSFLVYYLIHFSIVKIITKQRYGFYFDNNFYKTYCICIAMCTITFLLSYIESPIVKYSLMSVVGLICFAFVLHQINKIIAIKGLFNTIIKRKND